MRMASMIIFRHVAIALAPLIVVLEPFFVAVLVALLVGVKFVRTTGNGRGFVLINVSDQHCLSCCV